MKKSTLLFIYLFIVQISFSQVSVTYNFESLTINSPIHGQDNWFVHSSFGTVDYGSVPATPCPAIPSEVLPPTIVSSTTSGSYTGSKVLNTPLGATGNGNQHAFCSRVNNGAWSTPNMSGALGIVIEADMKGNWWGKQLRLGYDANGDGRFSSNCNTAQAGEISFGFGATTNSFIVYGANGNSIATTTRSNESSQWNRIRLCIDVTANGGQGAGYLFYKDHSTNGVWTITSIAGVNMGLNTSATNQTNYLNLNGIVFDQEAGSASFLDNITIDVYKTSFPGCVVALPIELLYFDALPVGNRTVQCGWTTSTEINNDYFNIEKSQDGANWESFAQLDGAGNSTNMLNYSYTDNSPYPGLSYYRLKQVDFDGNHKYSDIRVVNLNSNLDDGIHIYPNPTSGIITIIASKEELSGIEIINYLGQLVTNFVVIEESSETKTVLNLKNLPAGVYTIKTKTAVNKVSKY